jgi:hypothetical protein
MSRYVVRVVQRDGNPWYVYGEKLSDWTNLCTRFLSVEDAHTVANMWSRRFNADEAYIDVIDMDDPEKGSL